MPCVWSAAVSGKKKLEGRGVKERAKRTRRRLCGAPFTRTSPVWKKGAPAVAFSCQVFFLASRWLSFSPFSGTGTATNERTNNRLSLSTFLSQTSVQVSGETTATTNAHPKGSSRLVFVGGGGRKGSFSWGPSSFLVGVVGAELVHETLRTGRLLHDAFLVILADAPAEFVVVHGRAVFALAPFAGHQAGVIDLEDA